MGLSYFQRHCNGSMSYSVKAWTFSVCIHHFFHRFNFENIQTVRGCYEFTHVACEPNTSISTGKDDNYFVSKEDCESTCINGSKLIQLK